AKTNQNGKSAGLLYLEALVCVSKGDNEAALKNLNDSIELDGHNAAAYSERALVQFRLGQNDSALSDANAAISFNGSDALTYHRRALIQMRSKNYRAAISDIDLAEKLDPQRSHYYIYTNRGDAYVGLRQFADALKQYSLAVPMAPSGNVDALLGRAMCEG